VLVIAAILALHRPPAWGPWRRLARSLGGQGGAGCLGRPRRPEPDGGTPLGFPLMAFPLLGGPCRAGPGGFVREAMLGRTSGPDLPVEAAATPAAWPLSRALLEAVLADRTSDRFVCELIWPRLGYAPAGDGTWSAGPATEARWRESFPIAPQVIAERPASVALTRSIAKEHKQLLKQQLAFPGYKISELYPRRTRRATAVNWLLAHLAARGEALPDSGPLPPLLPPPADPVVGHRGDPPVG
jgi:hypothetical protein